MVERECTSDDRLEVARLRDQLEQLRTALEAASDEVDRLAEDRERLLGRVAAQARELQAANAAYERAVSSKHGGTTAELAMKLVSDESEEELRVAFEELQVLTEELEAANHSLHEANRALDTRVEERTREIQAKNRALADSELRFRTLIEGIPQLVWRAIDGGEWTWASPQWCAYTGLGVPDSVGMGWLRAFHPEDHAAAQAAWARAEAGAPLTIEARIYHQAEERFRHFRTRATAVRSDDGNVLEWLGTSTDVDDLLRLQERQAVLVAELQHRTRNLIAVVRSLSQRTLENAHSLDDFRGRFNTRLAALSRVQGLLSHLSVGERVSFDELLRSELAALGAPEDRLTIGGPKDVALRSATVQTFALALHELATNAVKYGALAAESGHLSVRWAVVDQAEDGMRRLKLDWRESGVVMPQISTQAPSKGYGRELIERALPYQLGARTTYELTADGVHCSIDVPVPSGSEKRGDAT